MSVVKFQYNENAITFESEKDSVMMNATEMAKQFKKKPIHWLKLPSTITFINTLSEVRKSHFDNLVITRQGGNTAMQGTWLHEDVALEFARWLSPSFAIWCNDRIKELLRHGATAINPDDLLNPDYVISLLQKIKESRAEADQLRQTTALQTRELKETATKVMYHDAVLQSESLIPTTIIAKELGISAIRLNQILHKHKILYRVGETWVLHSEHQGCGLTGTKTHHYTDSYGNDRTQIMTYWTELGRKFLHTYFNRYPEFLEE